MPQKQKAPKKAIREESVEEETQPEKSQHDDSEDLSKIFSDEPDKNIKHESYDEPSVEGLTQLTENPCANAENLDLTAINSITSNVASKGMQIDIKGAKEFNKIKKWKLKDPQRIVLDIEQACISNPKQKIQTPNNDVIEKITVTQFVSASQKYLSRIIIYLKQEAQYKLDESGENLILLVR